MSLLFVTIVSEKIQAQQIKFVDGLNPKSFIYNTRAGIPPPPPMGKHNPYRTFDGTNNNIGAQKGEWGATEIPLLRELPTEYGKSDPKNSIGGLSNLTPRKISNVLCDEPVTIFNSRNLSTFIYVWGQFLDHDINLTPTGNTEYSPIVLPNDEKIFTEPIPFYRSEVASGTGVTNPRQQLNLTTAWIDASVVYGSDSTRASWLRTKKYGKLKTSANNLLPWNTLNNEESGDIDINAPSMANDNNHKTKAYVAGDIRAGEHPGITSLHTLFVREHNRICDKLIAQGLKNDEEIYQKARKEIGALIQAITYQEFLPALGISLSSYTGYKESVRPDILNTFATASYRIGHTMVADEVALRSLDCEKIDGGSLELVDVFFNPEFVNKYGIDPFLKGLSGHKQYETNTEINSTLRNFLFGNSSSPVRFGLDLAAINIQRGRDHGLPNYKVARAFYTGNNINNFSQITSNPAKAAALQSLYGNVNNIDLWIGLLSEDLLPGKSVGRTMHEMLKVQFEKMRDGDYYFYKNDPFLPNNIKNEMSSVRLSDVIKRNTTLNNLQSNVFFINPCPGENGERLSKINNNILESTQVSLNSENSNELTNFKIYPNPVNGILNVAFENLKVPSTIKIINLSGMVVNSFKVDAGVDNFQINTSDYDAGVYFLNLSNEFLNQKTKFIKIKN